MKSRLKIFHIIFTFWVLLLLFRAGYIIDLGLLWIKYFLFAFNDLNVAFQIIDFAFFDALISSLLFIILPVIIYLLRRRSGLLNHETDFSVTVLIFLAFSFLFAPIISNANPDFQKDLRATKLLSPLSGVKIIHLKKNVDLDKNQTDKFLSYKNAVVHPSFNENIIIANKVAVNERSVIYWQNKIEKEISFDEILLRDEEPVVSNKLFLLGTDEFGRDIFARIIYGSRISLLVGMGSVLVSLIIGIVFGFIAGFRGGIIDVVLSRLSDLFLSFPIIYLVVLILALFGNSLFSVIVVLGLSGWMSLFKIVKSEVIAEKNKDYITTASMLGQSKRKILTREILPVILVPIIVNVVFQFSNVILAESALSYLGLGTGNSYPSWGAMIESGQRYISKAWWMISFPGLILIFTLFVANDFGKRLNKNINPVAGK